MNDDRELIRGLFFAFAVMIPFVLIGSTEPPHVAERKRFRNALMKTRAAMPTWTSTPTGTATPMYDVAPLAHHARIGH